MALKRQCADSDRISALPDALLCHILSFVPTKQYVQTSILSKRWSHVWTDVPYIDIDDSIMNLEPTLGTHQSVHASFTNFMTKVFNRGNKASLCKFALRSSKFDALHLNEWILAATKHRIGEIALSVSIGLFRPFKMSCGLFAYKELVTLKLGMNVVLHVPNGTFCFPSLKNLHLDAVQFNDASIHDLISRCPVLEDLCVERCSSHMWDNVVFSAPALKFFVINTSFLYVSSYDYKLIVDAPSLEVLNHTGYIAAKGYCFKNLNSLIHATLDVGIKEVDNIHCARELFRGVANAGTITLTGNTLWAIHLCLTHPGGYNFPLFNNLSKLELGGNWSCGYVLLQLLCSSPNLQVLVIDENLAMKGDLYNFHWDETGYVPPCLSLHLKVVEIYGFHNQHMGVGRFIRYILSNARALTKVSASLSKSQVTSKVEVNGELLVYLSSSGM